MAKAELKTKETTASVEAYLAKQPADTVADCRIIKGLMEKASGEEPRMWGTSMVGYGRYAYKGKAVVKGSGW